jgi:hypothetical protein
MKKELLQRIDDLQTTTIVNNTCIDKRFTRLEETLQNTIKQFFDNQALKSSMNDLLEGNEYRGKIIKDLEAEIIDLESRKYEFVLLCKTINDKTVNRKELIAYANSYLQDLEL